MLFWLDILPWDPTEGAVGEPLDTAAAWVEWLRSEVMVSVTRPRSTTIGTMRLPAMYVDVTDRPGGERFPDLITWPGAGSHVYGIGGPWTFRLYLADVTFDSTDHLLAIAVEGTDGSDLKRFLPDAERLIATVDAPIQPG